ncbi:MAG: hypothetical protein D6703_01035 [Zetaproteobacteria bacterium]|nr:MAG: hypothetical protein D6703_01035 [Zetaproteobacteria bacterium]
MNPEDLFLKAMEQVRPLEGKEKVQRRKKPPRPTPKKSERTNNRLALPDGHKLLMPLKPRQIEPWVLAANGMSRDQLRKLAGGQMGTDREIDLHGMTRDEALIALEQCLQAMRKQRERILCVIHGRGRHSDGQPVLKKAVFHWLMDGPFATSVLAVVPRRDSNGGASMVLFRREKR